MKRFRFLLPLFLVALSMFSAAPAWADSSHARIVRLSLVQGDVRVARDFKGDPLTDVKLGWERAVMNLPLRQGNAIATDNGRAEVEFESGAMAFLAPNSLLEFYDMSLQDGGRITRLILRQGSATFYVNPASGDYFSVTGGDFTVEATRRATFRMDNFDDGSTVNVEGGNVEVLRDRKSTPLTKGQSLTCRVDDPKDFAIGRLGDNDEFDRWVSSRIDTARTASNYSQDYVDTSSYSSGVADLYTYGSWFPISGYGYCWRPFGMGSAWSPFSFGSWYLDPVFGWTFVGSQPWGWLPYHYGGWVFSPAYGWVWVPSGLGFGQPVHYRPVTAVWVRNGAVLGAVPMHPADKNGKTPLNLAHGVYTPQGNALVYSNALAANEKWSTLKQAPADAFSASAASAASPSHFSRTLGNPHVTAGAGLTGNSTIVYDAKEHRFVNSDRPATHEPGAAAPSSNVRLATEQGAHPPAGNIVAPRVPPTAVGVVRPVAPRVPIAPPPARPTTSGGGGTTWGGTTRGTSSGSSHPSSPATSHPSSGAHPH